MSEGDAELKVGGLLGGIAVGEAVLLGVACPLCVAGAALLITVGSVKKVGLGFSGRRIRQRE